MLYDEYLVHTNARPTAKNYHNYEMLNFLYMEFHPELNKSEIYEMGKAINEYGLNKGEAERLCELKAQLESLKFDLGYYKALGGNMFASTISELYMKIRQVKYEINYLREIEKRYQPGFKEEK